MSLRITPLYKQPGEARLYSFNFANQVELDTGGETLTGTPTITVTRIAGTGTLTVGSPTISTTYVNFTISAGADGDRHRVVCTVSTSGGRTLQSAGELRVAYGT